MMMKYLKRCLSCLTLLCLLLSCTTSPTGRSQLKLMSDRQMAEMGATAFQQIKQEAKVSENAQTQHYVKCVAKAITGILPGEKQWEVQVFQDKAVNAFALPGGKIGVYEGLLGVAENQHQLAAVIGHEIAHVLADHGNARVSANFATEAGLQLLQVLSGAGSDTTKQQLFGLLGLGLQYGVLMPYNRDQESEADIIGLELMAKAGFNPRESTNLWRNMAASGGAQAPEFLSTHPSHDSRINKLNTHMTDAMALYKKAISKGRAPACG